MAKRRKRTSRAASECVSEEIAKHCHKKRGKCRRAKERKQAIAIGYSICRRKGFKSIPSGLSGTKREPPPVYFTPHGPPPGVPRGPGLRGKRRR
jgi:Family of unknown function (DUF6496)